MRTVTPSRIRVALWTVCALLGGGLVLPASAGAYVPPVIELLHMMRQALGKTEALSVDQRVTVFQTDTSAGSGVLERLKYAFPNRLRSEIKTGSVKRIYIVSGGRHLTVIDGQVVSEIQGRYDLYTDILLYDLEPLLERRLASLGLNTAVSSLGRLDGRLVYVVGARYPDTAGCQLWLDKETLRPVRWLLAPQGEPWAAGRLDIRYGLWQSVDSIWYPWEVRFYQGSTLVRRIDVERVEAAPGFHDEFFDMDALKRTYSAAGSTDRPASSPTEKIRQTIENFHRLYEDQAPVQE